MANTNHPDSSYRHASATIALHWLTFFLVLTMVTAVLVQDYFDSDAVSHALVDLHRSLGLIVMLLVPLRVLVKEPINHPVEDTPLGKWQPIVASIMHGTIYLLLVAIPLLGWAHSSASGKPMQFFWVVAIPRIAAKNRDLAETLQDWHENAAWLLIALIACHALVAIWHHYYHRDRVLYSMLPLNKLAQDRKY